MTRSDRRGGLLYVPKNYAPGRPAALIVMLHGAGGNAEHGLSLLRQFADERNIVLVVLASRLGSWDIISTDVLGKDIVFIDQALSLLFAPTPLTRPGLRSVALPTGLPTHCA